MDRGVLAERPNKVGDAYDNASVESFFATLEREMLDRRRFASQAQARTAVFTFIEGFSNPVRLHSALGCRSPIRDDQEMRSPHGSQAFRHSTRSGQFQLQLTMLASGSSTCSAT